MEVWSLGEAQTTLTPPLFCLHNTFTFSASCRKARSKHSSLVFSLALANLSSQLFINTTIHHEPFLSLIVNATPTIHLKQLIAHHPFYTKDSQSICAIDIAFSKHFGNHGRRSRQVSLLRTQVNRV